MDKQEYKEKHKELVAEAKRRMEAEPEVNRWFKTKTWIFRFFAIYFLLHGVLAIFAYMEVGTEFKLAIEILRPLFQIFWLFVVINPRGTWRLNIILYLWGASNFIVNTKTYFQNIQGSFSLIMVTYPLSGILLIMEILIPFFFFAAACYLTIPAKHRRMSERIEELQKALTEEVKGLGK